MTYAVKYLETDNVFTIPEVTKGDVYLFNIPKRAEVVVEATLVDKKDGSYGQAGTYTSIQQEAPVTFDSMVMVNKMNEKSFQDVNVIPGQSWIGVKVSGGTWKVSVVTNRNITTYVNSVEEF